MRVVLCRAGKEIQAPIEVPNWSQEYQILHYQNLPLRFDEKVDLESSMMTVWREMFILNKDYLGCPHCHCRVMNSVNYMKAPEWLIKQNFNA